MDKESRTQGTVRFMISRQVNWELESRAVKKLSRRRGTGCCVITKPFRKVSFLRIVAQLETFVNVVFSSIFLPFSYGKSESSGENVKMFLTNGRFAAMMFAVKRKWRGWRGFSPFFFRECVCGANAWARGKWSLRSRVPQPTG